MTIPFIGPDIEPRLDWLDLTRALAAGHILPRASIGDTLLSRDPDTLLSRAAWIDGLGQLVKTATIFPRNADLGKPTISGAVSLFSDTDGTLEAMLDFALVTKWKTAGDSLAAALKLAPPVVRNILIVGAGTVAGTLREAYGAGFPDATFTIWARDAEKARAFAQAHDCAFACDLAQAVTTADIVTTATMATSPVLRGDWLRPGQHIDLIGAYRPDMRELDDAGIARGALFVDSRATTVDHIGEIRIPLDAGVITAADIRADFYDGAAFVRPDADAITVFKNGGGAHLDLMVARYILDAARG
jgi:ornithine cyclodeaminase/alanine dehydrogenase-like protein (mu-crystallin family)